MLVIFNVVLYLIFTFFMQIVNSKFLLQQHKLQNHDKYDQRMHFLLPNAAE